MSVDYGAMIGDEVRIDFQGGFRVNGTVKHIPQGVGDSWIVWSNDGTIHHVQQFEEITVMNRKAKEETRSAELNLMGPRGKGGTT